MTQQKVPLEPVFYLNFSAYGFPNHVIINSISQTEGFKFLEQTLIFYRATGRVDFLVLGRRGIEVLYQNPLPLRWSPSKGPTATGISSNPTHRTTSLISCFMLQAPGPHWYTKTTAVPAVGSCYLSGSRVPLNSLCLKVFLSWAFIYIQKRVCVCVRVRMCIDTCIHIYSHRYIQKDHHENTSLIEYLWILPLCQNILKPQKCKQMQSETFWSLEPWELKCVT